MKSKKFVFAMVAALTVVGAAGLVSCGGTTESNVINIQFLPSNDPATLGALAARLEPVLNKIEPNYTFKISTGTSYAACTEAMLSDQIDIGFLTASGYAQVTLQHPGSINVLLTSVRKGYKVQVDDYKGDVAKQIAAMNGEISGYEYLGQQSDTDVNWYTSQLCVGNQYYKDANGDGKIDIHDMAGLTIGRMGATSGAGYLRPLKYLNDNGMEMVDNVTDATKQIKGVEEANYGAAYNDMQSGLIAGFWGFTDVRYAQGYIKTDSAYYKKAEAFTLSKCVAITDGIYNDTISTRANLSDAKQKAVVNAFTTAVKDKTTVVYTDDKGNNVTPADILYKVYSHTGYTAAKDSDFDGERAFYKYCVDHNLIK